MKESLAAAVHDIASALRPTAETSWSDVTLGSGSSGEALFLMYYARWTGDAAIEREAARLLSHAMDSIETTPMAPTHLTGFVGVAWVVAHAMRERFVDVHVDLTAVDDAVVEHLASWPLSQPLDLTLGAVGCGVYLLERPPSSARTQGLSHLARLLVSTPIVDDRASLWFTPPTQLSLERERLAPDGLWDLGVAHGAAGLLLFLAALHRMEGIDEVVFLIERVAKAVIAEIRCFPEGGMFPHWLPRGRPLQQTSSRLAWCYGDPGVACALIAAGRALCARSLLQLGVQVLTDGAHREPSMTGLVDGSLCHGSSGLAQMYLRAAHVADAPALMVGASRWREHLLALRVPDRGVGGFRYTHYSDDTSPPVMVSDRGFLQGAAGIGLALISALDPTAGAWDRSLLIGHLA